MLKMMLMTMNRWWLLCDAWAGCIESPVFLRLDVFFGFSSCISPFFPLVLVFFFFHSMVDTPSPDSMVAGLPSSPDST